MDRVECGMDNKEPEHWTTWLARKCYKSSFRSRENRSSYSPKTNTPGLYDGSSEARKIIRSAKEEAIDNPIAFGALTHALDYLKGKDILNMGGHTGDFFNEPTQTPR